MSDSNTYEMLWDCQYCGAKQNLGLTHRFCPNCGAPQNPDSRYYPSDDEKIAVHDHRFVGVDVICPACSELNSAAAEYCGQCGSPLTEAARASTLAAQSRAQGQEFESSGSRDITKERFDSRMQALGLQPEPESKQKRGGTNWGVIAVLGLLAALVVGAFIAFSWTTDSTFLVVDQQWERIINVQEYNSFSERSWRDSRPSGDNVDLVFGSCREEQRSTRRIPDGETCQTVRSDNGDGTFSERQQCTTNYREEPVYDDMCTWEGFRWEGINPLQTSHEISNSLVWPEASFDECLSLQVGCQREASREEVYWIIFENTDDDTRHRCQFSLQEWEEIPIESLWTGQSRALGGGIICDSLQRQN